jgi:hypothetical protein
MSLPSLDKRALSVLRKEREHLQGTYERCAEIFGPECQP